MTDTDCLYCGKPFFDDDANVIRHNVCDSQRATRIKNKECSRCGKPAPDETTIWCPDCDDDSPFKGYEGPDIGRTNQKILEPDDE